MAKENVIEFSATAGSNTDVDSVSLAEGMAASGVNNAIRALMALVKEWHTALGGAQATTGSSGTFALTSGLGGYDLTDGTAVGCTCNHATTGASTLNVDSTGAKAIRVIGQAGERDTQTGDIIGDGHYLFHYDASLDGGSGAWMLLNPSMPASVGTLNNVVEDTTPQLGGDLDPNGNGIAFTGGTVTDISGADLILISGTAGTSGYSAHWNADGDLVDGKAQPTGAVVGTSDSQTLSNKTLGAVTLSGAVSGADQIVSRINLKDYGEVTVALGSIGGGTQDLDLELGNVFTGTVDTSTTTLTFSNPTASDECCSFSLILTNGGSQTVNYPASVDWAGGTAPSLTTSGVDWLEFSTVDGGTIWNGFSAGLDMG